MADPRRSLQTARISRATQWTAAVIGGFRLNRLEVHAALLMEVQRRVARSKLKSLLLPTVVPATHLDEV